MSESSQQHSLDAPIIEMTDVAVASARKADWLVVDEVNWRVLPGDYWVVGGLPGSGKSGLLTTAAGLSRPLRGHHRLYGREIDRLREDEFLEERLRVGLVFDEGGRLFNQLTVAQNVALPLCYHRKCTAEEVKEQVHAILEWTGLDSYANETPGQINRSWQQRVGLARALVLKPEVLLLDNPLAGVEPRQIRWWLDFLSALSAGHENTNGQRITLVVTCGNFRPWLDQGKQFALIKESAWLPLGGRAELEKGEEPLLQELLAAAFAAN